MSDDRTKAGQTDRDRINVSENYERRDWARKLGVTEDQLVKAVQKVGPMAADVTRELKGK
jgi:hypothetical protein